MLRALAIALMDILQFSMSMVIPVDRKSKSKSKKILFIVGTL